ANCELHLIGPMGFVITDSHLKRAGLDYWPHLRWHYHENFASWWSLVEDENRVFYLSTKAQKYHTEAQYQEGDWLVFGKETKGLDPQLIQRNIDRALKIPQLGPTRSLNLATAVAVVAFEGLRQLKVY